MVLRNVGSVLRLVLRNVGSVLRLVLRNVSYPLIAPVTQVGREVGRYTRTCVCAYISVCIYEISEKSIITQGGYLVDSFGVGR